MNQELKKYAQHVGCSSDVFTWIDTHLKEERLNHNDADHVLQNIDKE